MIYKIGTIADMDSIVFESDDVKQLVYHYARILTEEYGEMTTDILEKPTRRSSTRLMNRQM